MKKKLYVLILAIIIILSNTVVFANDTEEDDEDEMYYEEIRKEILETSATPLKEPSINSRAAVVIDRESKRVLYGKNEDKKRAMASTTKIMTCILAIENCRLDETIKVSKTAAAIGGSTLGLSAGDKITMNDLLYGLMLCSGNDAAEQIAETIGGSREGFADLMNKKAKELGLKNTHFVTPHGLDDEDHYTTAYELAILTDYALSNSKFAQIVNTKTKSILINGRQDNISNTNELLGYMEGVNGVKTGFTGEAGRCLVVSCKRNGLNLISVVLGADTKRFRTKDSMQILEYCFENYSQVNLKEKVEREFESWCKDNNIAIIKGKRQSIEPQIEKIAYTNFPLKNEEEKKIDIQVECASMLEAPVYEGMKVGTLKVKLGEEEILELKLTIPHTIDKKEPIDYWYDIWNSFKILNVARM